MNTFLDFANGNLCLSNTSISEIVSNDIEVKSVFENNVISMNSVNATFENVENDDANDNNFRATLKNDDNSVHATSENVDTSDYNVHVTLTARGDNNVYTTLAKNSNSIHVNLYDAEECSWGIAWRKSWFSNSFAYGSR